MFIADGLTDQEINEIRIACAYLFSPELASSDEFLQNLNMETVKKAYREKAKRYHPDLHLHEEPDIVEKRKQRFVKIRNSYESLVSSLAQVTERPYQDNGNRKKVIAVAGAKGGVGKTMFVANLGVLLSAKGWKTVVVDLDLGGANLHLFLGQTQPKETIGDFINHKVTGLDRIMIKNRYGPWLIAGDGSEFGIANIGFQKKFRLLNAVKQIDADYVIVDLGGDTAYNVVDFFLPADIGFVITTCDPASYLDAYNFIKVALFRKLDRLFGPESEFKDRRDNVLEGLIQEALWAPDGTGIKAVDELISRVQQHRPECAPLLKEVLSHFNPYLIVNRVDSDSGDVKRIVERMQEVAGKMLSIDLPLAGILPYQKEVELCTRGLIPVAARYPKGEMAKRIQTIAKKIFDGFQTDGLRCM